jgi:hypothetical protein
MPAMSDNSFNKSLRRIGVGTRMSAVAELVRQLRAEAALSEKPKHAPDFVDPAEEAVEPLKPAKPEPVVVKTVEELTSELEQLQSDYEKVSALLDLYQTHFDAMLPNMEAVVETSIYDEKSAALMLATYDRIWFSKVLLSEDGKVRIAAVIYQSAIRYTQSDLELVKGIMERNPVLMEHIALPLVD